MKDTASLPNVGLTDTHIMYMMTMERLSSSDEISVQEVWIRGLRYRSALEGCLASRTSATENSE